MSLEGRLEDLSLADIFQIIHLGKKSGVLKVEGPSGKGRVVFQDGQILYATIHGWVRLGERLIKEGLIKEKDLEYALRIQKDRKVYEPLGSILAENKLVDKDTLEGLLREQIKEVVYELISWEKGSFVFEPEKPTDEVPLGGSISPEYLLLEGTRLKDEGSRVIDDTEEAGYPVQPLKKGMGSSGILISLIEEISIDSTATEILLMVLRMAGEVLNRAVLFIIRDGQAEGFGQVGVSIKGADQRIKALRVPLDKPSVISYASHKKMVYKGPVPEENWNEYLVKHIGEGIPTEVFVAPVIEDNEVIAVLYGDNLPSKGPVEDTTPLEAFIKVSGMVLTASNRQYA